jgi:hypothetical protein
MTLLGKVRNGLLALLMTGALVGGGAAIASAATGGSGTTAPDAGGTATQQATPGATPVQDDDRGDCPEGQGGAPYGAPESGSSGSSSSSL